MLELALSSLSGLGPHLIPGPALQRWAILIAEDASGITRKVQRRFHAWEIFGAVALRK